MKSSPLPDKCVFKEQVPPQFSLQGHRHNNLCLQHTCNYLDMQYSFLFCLAFFPTQEVDDVARVSEAVTKAVVSALKSAPSDDNTDDWLNPTEVAN